LTGTIPSTLLKNTKTDGRWVSINLTSNVLNGLIPVNLILFLSDYLPKEFCEMSDWMLVLVAKYKCNAILCPKNTMSQGITEIASNSSMEREISTELYHKTNGNEWSNNDGWLDKDRGICSWYGVQCKIRNSMLY
jgi:hypothetical protein